MAERSEKQLEELRTSAKTAREAAVEATRQMAILWEAKLNMAIAAADDVAIRDSLQDARAQMYMDNCNCGGGGGTAFLG